MPLSELGTADVRRLGPRLLAGLVVPEGVRHSRQSTALVQFVVMPIVVFPGQVETDAVGNRPPVRTWTTCSDKPRNGCFEGCR